jgi:hypothetical protein
MELLVIDELENEENDTRCSGRDKNQVPLEHQPDEFFSEISVFDIYHETVCAFHFSSPQTVRWAHLRKSRSALSLDTRTTHKTRLRPISAQSCYNIVLTILATVHIHYKALPPKNSFLGSMFFMKCDKLIQKTKHGLDSKVPFSLVLGQRSSGNSLFCYSPRRKRLLNISSTLSTWTPLHVALQSRTSQ